MLVVWSFVKRYWHYIVVLAGALFGILAFRNDIRGLFALLDDTKRRHDEELAAIREAHRREIEERERALERYRLVIEEVEKRFAAANAELTASKRAEVKRIVEEVGDDPRALAERLSKATGIDVGS